MGEPLSTHMLSDLIGSIYDCTLDPSRWDETLAEIVGAFEGEVVNLSLIDLRRDRLLIEKSVGWGQEWLEERQKHLPEIHARLGEWLAHAPSLDEPFVASMHLDPSYLEAAPYVQDCLKPRGIADIMHVFLVRTPAQFSELVVGRHERHGIITAREIELGKLLLPHLRRAVMISHVLDARAIEGARMADALDQLRCGVVLTDAEGGVLHANRPAEEMMRAGGPIRSVGGVLQVAEPAARRELVSAIRAAADDEATIGRHGVAIRLTEPDRPPAFAHVLPMTGSDLRTGVQPEAVAAVFIGAAPDGEADAGAIAAACGLTPAQTRILASLLAGRSLAETAADHAIAPSTAKSHLENIFLKTGTSRQSDLVRLAMRLSPPVRPNSRPASRPDS